MAGVVGEFLVVHAAIALRVAWLFADPVAGAAEPAGAGWRQLPVAIGAGRRMRNGLRAFRFDVTGAAGQGLVSDAAFTGLDSHAVWAGFAIARPGPHWDAGFADMAIGTARMGGDLTDACPGLPSRERSTLPGFG